MAKEAVEKATENALQTPEIDSKKKDEKPAKTSKPSKPAKEKKNIFKRIFHFFKDLKSEFKKIVWPSKKQIINNTAVVISVMLIVGICIWIIDYVFINIFRLMY